MSKPLEKRGVDLESKQQNTDEKVLSLVTKTDPERQKLNEKDDEKLPDETKLNLEGIMGFQNFGSSKNKKVQSKSNGGRRVKKPSTNAKYRQYIKNKKNTKKSD
ncbi:LAMI_0H00342g1_1 [Lachancea mirantina]|uniref:LAMI_0H00342g1_1 n=1 Tax=Lachancea mirantina TaxID=1230905 RepID=A0A1G4KDF4_9SACH|nr:LAMI_0H00342g1_1 [Lachancea mirantina]